MVRAGATWSLISFLYINPHPSTTTCTILKSDSPSCAPGLFNAKNFAHNQNQQRPHSLLCAAPNKQLYVGVGHAKDTLSMSFQPARLSSPVPQHGCSMPSARSGLPFVNTDST